MDELIVSVSGLRGIVGTSLTAEVAVRYAEAFLATLPPGPVVIGRDGRASGRMFADAIAAVDDRHIEAVAVDAAAEQEPHLGKHGASGCLHFGFSCGLSLKDHVQGRTILGCRCNRGLQP